MGVDTGISNDQRRQTRHTARHDEEDTSGQEEQPSEATDDHDVGVCGGVVVCERVAVVAFVGSKDKR
jgi:hypothetical protein